MRFTKLIFFILFTLVYSTIVLSKTLPNAENLNFFPLRSDKKKSLESFLVKSRYENGAIRSISFDAGYVKVGNRSILIFSNAIFYPSGELKYARRTGRVELKPTHTNDSVFVDEYVHFRDDGSVISGVAEGSRSDCIKPRRALMPVCSIISITLHSKTLELKRMRTGSQSVVMPGNRFKNIQHHFFRENGTYSRMGAFEPSSVRKRFLKTSPKIKINSYIYGNPFHVSEDGYIRTAVLEKNTSHGLITSNNEKIVIKNKFNSYVKFNTEGKAVSFIPSSPFSIKVNNTSFQLYEKSRVELFDDGNTRSFTLFPERHQFIKLLVKGSENLGPLELTGHISIEKGTNIALSGKFEDPTRILFDELNPSVLVNSFNFREHVITKGRYKFYYEHMYDENIYKVKKSIEVNEREIFLTQRSELRVLSEWEKDSFKVEILPNGEFSIGSRILVKPSGNSDTKEVLVGWTASYWGINKLSRISPNLLYRDGSPKLVRAIVEAKFLNKEVTLCSHISYRDWKIVRGRMCEESGFTRDDGKLIYLKSNALIYPFASMY